MAMRRRNFNRIFVKTDRGTSDLPHREAHTETGIDRTVSGRGSVSEVHPFTGGVRVGRAIGVLALVPPCIQHEHR